MDTIQELAILDEMAVSMLKTVLERHDPEPYFVGTRGKYSDRLDMMLNVNLSWKIFREITAHILDEAGWMLENVRLQHTTTDIYVRGCTFVRIIPI